MTVLVTGATGRVGGRVAAALADRGVAVRALVRDPARAGSLPAGVDLVVGDYADPASLGRAFAGVERAFMVCLSEPAPARLRQHDQVVAAARDAGVAQVAYLSFLAASSEAGFPQGRWHAHTEASLAAAGVPSTHLRAGLFQSSLLTTAGLRVDDRLLAPAGRGRTAPVAWQDVADAAAAVLIGPGHTGCAYDLTGPELLDWDDVAGALSSASGERVVYESISTETYRSLLAGAGAPPELVDGLAGLFDDIRVGRLAALSDAVQVLTGGPATPVATTFARTEPRVG